MRKPTVILLLLAAAAAALATRLFPIAFPIVAISDRIGRDTALQRADSFISANGLAPDSARCSARVTRDGVADECHMVAYWAPGQVGDASTPATAAGWRHVDPDVDAHHTPEINL